MNKIFKVLILIIIALPFLGLDAVKDDVVPLRISMQQMIPSVLDKVGWDMTSRIEGWKPNETAIIICDMWDKHWCDDATERVAELAPEMNKVITIARERGVKIIHSPSDCIDYYAKYPGRKEAMKYNDKKITALADGSKLPAEENATWPIDQSDEGCENEDCKPHKIWTKQIHSLTIKEQDLISDSGAEIGAYFKNTGITNVILMGVHTNMCVIGRSFGLRAMKRMGMNVVLMRDMTDLMYNHKMPPYVNHFTGLDLMVEYIETYVCPTIVSTDFTGKKQFHFERDNRPRVAFLTAESEYRASQRLPEFAHDLALENNINCDFALGIPIMDNAQKDADLKVKAEYAAYGMPIDTDGKTFPPTRHNIENLQILEDADLAVIFIHRRALEPDKMAMIRNYIASGRPVLGIRTASHAFDTMGNDTYEGDGIETAKENASELIEQWSEFDEQVLGGNYQGNVHSNTGTDVSIVSGMENHPILNGVEMKFKSPIGMYKNRPLRTSKAQVLLLGSNPGVPNEPLMWVKDNVIYTSLGHCDDWENQSFRKLMFNSVTHLLNQRKCNP